MALRLPAQLAQLAVASDKRGQLRPKVRQVHGRRAQGREVIWEARDLELVDALRLVEVLELMHAQVTEGDVARVRQEVGGGLRNEDLPAVRGGSDPRTSMQPDAHVLVAGVGYLARVDAHANPNRIVIRPGMGGQVPLRLLSCLDGVRRPTKGGQKGVAFCADLVAFVSGDRFPKDSPMVLERGPIPVGADLGQQARRSLDVCEQERNGARWPLRHARQGTSADGGNDEDGLIGRAIIETDGRASPG